METKKVEYRTLPAVPTVRAGDVEGKGGNRLVGYTAKFDEPSEVLFDPYVVGGGFVEVIAPGAFDRTLREHPDIRALYNHNTDHVLGRTKAGTLTLTVDETGLAFEVMLPDTTIGRDVREMVGRGDIDGCSFGFMVVKDEIVQVPGEPARRTLIDIDLFEISPAVVFPAYASTEVSVRSKAKQSRPVLEWAKRKYRLIEDY